jgi:hypothetical protein
VAVESLVRRRRVRGRNNGRRLMLVDAQGKPIGPIPKAEHWRLFEALLQDDSLAAPLRDAVNGYIDSEVAAALHGQEVGIDSTAAGPQVFGRLGSQWLTDYKRWHAGMCAQNPEYKSITSERMYGMMLWYVLAADRPERWEVPPQGEKRVYKLLDRAVSTPQVSPERRMLLELREALRGHLDKLDALLGDI